MDMDAKLIAAVRKQPCLYVYNFNIEERKRGWKQLSEKLKMNELYLKIRWHHLVQRYLNEAEFKYAQQMDFVKLKEKHKSQKGNWPEFEITEQDVLEIEETTEEYVFLDVEDLEENSCKESKDDTLKNERDDNQLSNELLSSLMDSVTSDSEKCDKNESNMNTILVSTDGNNQNKENLDDIVPVENITKTQESTTVTEHKNTAANDSFRTNNDRSEDDIFGELVAAMLKHMDTDKKRMVKKEIMNLLLT